MSLDSLNPQQLTQVKKQLDDEVAHLTNSFAQLHAAQGKFKECLRCVKTGDSQGALSLWIKPIPGRHRSSSTPSFPPLPAFFSASVHFASAADKKITTIAKKNDRDILVPLTNSLYVRGKLTNPDRVIVDVGTGFYVEKVSAFPP